MKPKLLHFWKEWVKPAVIVLAIMVPFRSSIADWNVVPTGSMKPTIFEGDRIFVNKLAYDLKVPLTKQQVASWGDPKVGDIVVCFSPADGKRLVKRVAGVPGDPIAWQQGMPFINEQPATYYPPARDALPDVVPDGQYFLLGDNRNNSADSRAFGFVAREQIVGEATATVISLDKTRWYKPRFDRFFQRLR